MINTDKIRSFFSSKYEGPYIDLNRLEKNFGSVFFAFRAVAFQVDKKKLCRKYAHFSKYETYNLHQISAYYQLTFLGVTRREEVQGEVWHKRRGVKIF